jgi:homoserine trans-succinylase
MDMHAIFSTGCKEKKTKTIKQSYLRNKESIIETNLPSLQFYAL